MSIHDIYDADKKKTGHKFSSKANDLRDDDEYSLNVLVFVILEGKLIVCTNDDKTSFYTIEDLVEADESSVRAAERVLYKSLAYSVNGSDLKLVATKCIDNNFYDVWSIELNYSSHGVDSILDRDDVILITRETFEEMIENRDFNYNIKKESLDLLLGDKNAVKVRPLIRKSNLY